MSEPPRDEERDLTRRHAHRLVGTFLLVLGIGLAGVAAADFAKSVLRDQPLRYDWLLFVGVGVLIVGWWFLRAHDPDDSERVTDCPSCGAFVDERAQRCPRCAHEL